jgi:hypothetical protein
MSVKGLSVPAEAARWLDRLQLSEIEIADRPQCFGGRTVLKTVRQAVQPGSVLDLCFHKAGDMICPTPGPAAMIERAPHADDRFAGRARRTIAGLSFGVGHGCFTDRFARDDFHSEALRHETPGAHARFLKRQLSLPVSTMSQ